MRRRDFIRLIGTTAAWPLAASAQRRTMPVVGVLYPATLDADTNRMNAVRQGLKDAGYIEGENVMIEYRARLKISLIDCRHWRAISLVAKWT
jgi:putative ABC transport system substrate-binding protein